MRVESKDGLMTWVLDRPDQGNGIDEATMASMEAALDTLEKPDGAFGALCIAGDKTVFSTGLDGAMLEVCFESREAFSAVVERMSKVLDRLEALPIVTIACIDGECRLGGVELALVCDVIVAGEGAAICDGHLAYDAMPGGGATKRLPARIGYSGALRFILEAPVLDAGQAKQWGLVDELAPAGEAHRRGEALAATVAQRDQSLIRAIKASLRAASPVSADQSYLKAFQRSVIDRLIPA